MNKKSPNDSVFKSKRFYVALYSCLGVLLVLAAVISFMNLNTVRKNENDAIAKTEPQQSQVAPVVKNEAESYLTPEDRSIGNLQASSANAEIMGAKPTDTPAEPKATEVPKASTPPKSTAPVQAAPSSKPSTPKLQPQTTNETKEEEPEAAAIETPPESPQEAAAEDKPQAERGLAAPIFSSFTEESKMLWPVTGEIVMQYSPESLIYDVTLEQYRTNNSISIAAEAGSQVKASADGVVKNVVFQDTEDGNKVVIDNGNGWLTTYSQLQDQILVKEGDVVKAGQVIGSVNNPTRSGILLGSHLKFSVTKDDSYVDPKILLATN